jgi:hypothetical protein
VSDYTFTYPSSSTRQVIELDLRLDSFWKHRGRNPAYIVMSHDRYTEFERQLCETHRRVNRKRDEEPGPPMYCDIRILVDDASSGEMFLIP